MRNAKYEIQNTKYKIQDGARGPLTAFAKQFLRAGPLTAFAERFCGRGRSLRSLNGFAGGAAHCVR